MKIKTVILSTFAAIALTAPAGAGTLLGGSMSEVCLRDAVQRARANTSDFDAIVRFASAKCSVDRSLARLVVEDELAAHR